MINFNTPKLAKNNTSDTLDFSSSNIQSVKEVDLLFSDPNPVTVKPDAGYLGLGEVVINHPPVEEVTEVVVNKLGKQRITPSEGYDATQAVDIDVQGETKTVDITKNGTYTVSSGSILKQVTINANIPQQTAVDISTGVKFSNSTWTTIPFEFTGQPTDCSSMFISNKQLTTIPEIDTSKATTLRSMFSTCNNLTTVPELDLSEATDTYDMFYYCSKITNVKLLSTGKITDCREMFESCTSLANLDEIDLSNAVQTNNMFRNASRLTNLGGFVGLKTSLDVSSSSRITKESLLNIINKAATVTSGTLTLGSINLTKLTDEEKAIATNKGWTLA